MTFITVISAITILSIVLMEYLLLKKHNKDMQAIDTSDN